MGLGSETAGEVLDPASPRAVGDLAFARLGPHDYERGKRVLDKAKHPGFVGREFFFRCATKGVAILATRAEVDVGIVLVDHKHVLQTLSVVTFARKYGVGSALVAEARERARWVKAIEGAVQFFERNGYERVGALDVGQPGKKLTQMMRRREDWAPSGGVARVREAEPPRETSEVPSLPLPSEPEQREQALRCLLRLVSSESVADASAVAAARTLLEVTAPVRAEPIDLDAALG